VKRGTIFLISVCLACTLSGRVPPQAVAQSTEYQVFLPMVARADRYSFLVAGHTYGLPGVDNPGLHPPFRALFPQINADRLSFGVLTGDIVVEGTADDWDEVDAELAELLFPVYLAVGNHDVSNRALFVSRYGPTYYSFAYHGDLFIVLDGELDACNISGEQMAFLREALDGSEARNVFVFVHKLIWVVDGTPYYVLRARLNGPGGYDFQGNFWTEVEPLLSDLNAQVYIVAGDVGAPWAMPLFYERYENIHLVASGMGGSEEENFLIFEVDRSGVQIRARRLDGQPLNRGTIEAYDLAYYGGVE
jgi:hypothetical protein